jgi:hypothetical protein
MKRLSLAALALLSACVAMLLASTAAMATPREDAIKMFEHGRQIVLPCHMTLHSIEASHNCFWQFVWGGSRDPNARVPTAVLAGANYQMLVMAQEGGFQTIIQSADVFMDVNKYFRNYAEYCVYFAVDCAPLDRDWKEHGFIHEQVKRKQASAK